MKSFQHVTAPQDRNGNPQRLFMVYEGEDIYAINEGYKGKPAFLREYYELVPIKVSVAEYRAWRSEDTREKHF